MTSTIKHSTTDDLHAIKEWLEAEKQLGIEGNFLCNWSAISQSHDDRKLWVYIDGDSEKPVAFQLGGLVHPGIMQVRNEFRRKGIGKKLAEHCIKDARRRGQTMLYIQCTPLTSIPFWQQMGFTLLKPDSYGDQYATRVLDRKHKLPADGNSVSAVIRFFPQDRWSNPHVASLLTATPTAKLRDGVVYLAERVQLHKQMYELDGDVVIEIVIDNKQIYLGKAKYDDAKNLGCLSSTHGFVIDRINLARSIA